ncbi:YppG family protein [Ferdinandcohnia quinoae]|uniref:YppG family protein n=1 Tax=Fredinandcohnia quinoae TaxID=2918902 RepID=A0AAW5EBW6_9BACI|nr:YppG family protein [Fredinandcohnia sp. SECRCQ15]MCH1627382.1 YppG family protein [Fredinandcohnia sp. SECRCQ15]
MRPIHRPPRRRPFYPPKMHGYSQSNPFINSFKTPDGHWDMNKISNSIGKASKLYGQVNPLLKQFTSYFKR